jgi:uncharacterized membrane protein
MQLALLAEIPWHHVHPILVNFTAALVPASVGSDLLAKITGRSSLRQAAWWTLLYAAVVTPATALSGWIRKKEIAGALPPDIIFRHQWLGSLLAVGFVALLIWRGRTHACGKDPSWSYLFTACAVVALLIYQGNLGGTMVFG